jgi:hypothetical protein
LYRCGRLSQKDPNLLELVRKQLSKRMGRTYNGRPRCVNQLVSTTQFILIVPFNAGYAMSSKLISVIGSRGRLSGSLARAEGSECMTGENLSKRPAVERNSENIGRSWNCRRARRNSENRFQYSCSGGLSVRISASSKARTTRGHRGPSFESRRSCSSRKLQSILPTSRRPSPCEMYRPWSGSFSTATCLQLATNWRKRSFSQKKQERKEIYLLGRINYIRIESTSIGIRSVICLTFGHMLAEGRCQHPLAFFGQWHILLRLGLSGHLIDER